MVGRLRTGGKPSEGREQLRMLRQQGDKALVEAPKPNFANSGLLAKETNTVKGVELKYNEPPEARKPLKNWRLYVFKGKEQLGEQAGRDSCATDDNVNVDDRSHPHLPTVGVFGRERPNCP